MNAAVLCADATVFLWYAFGALPLHLSVVDQLGLDPARASSWISIVWMSSAVTSIAISLRYRQPIPITWTIPGLVLLGAVGGNFSAPELAGACLAAGVALLVLGMAGAGAQEEGAVTGLRRHVPPWLARRLGTAESVTAEDPAENRGLRSIRSTWLTPPA